MRAVGKEVFLEEGAEAREMREVREGEEVGGEGGGVGGGLRWRGRVVRVSGHGGTVVIYVQRIPHTNPSSEGPSPWTAWRET
jgi:hypothetical protein